MRQLPPPGSVDLVAVRDVSNIASDLGVSAEEERVAARHATEELALRSRGARGLMRLVASHYLGCRPEEVPITPAACIHCGESHGKPIIDGSPVQINLSHTGDTVLIAVASLPVGVDVESGASGDAVAMSRRFYSTAEAEWVKGAGLDGGEERFLRLWVRKEAILKATSEGLLGGLDTVPVLGSTPLTVARLVAGEPSSWTVADVDPVIVPFAAVALAGDACELRLLSLADLD